MRISFVALWLVACASSAPAAESTLVVPAERDDVMTLAFAPGDVTLPAPTVRMSVEGVIDPRAATLTQTVHFEGAPPLFVALVDTQLSVRCADGTTRDACRAQPLRFPPEMSDTGIDRAHQLWAIRGDAPTLVLTGTPSDSRGEVGMERPPTHVGIDLIELQGAPLLLSPLSFAHDHLTLVASFRIDGEPSVMWPAAIYEGPFRDFRLTAMASAALVTEHVACGTTGIDVSYDEDFPGRESALRLAGVACAGLDTMRARWGEPEGAGPMRLWLPPRRGTGYYLRDRTLVVPAYYGWDARPEGGSWSLHEESVAEGTYTDIATLHELAHAWFWRSPSASARSLHEGMAAYASDSALLATHLARSIEPPSFDQVVAALHSPRGLDAYEIGALFLGELERTRGTEAVDEVLRTLRGSESHTDEEIDALVATRLGEVGTMWLTASRGHVP